MIGEVVWSANLYWLAGRTKKKFRTGDDAVRGASESLGNIDIVAWRYHVSKLLLLQVSTGTRGRRIIAFHTRFA
jgi:hypothetical protein